MTRNDPRGRTIAVALAVTFLTGLVPGCGSDDDGMETNPCVGLQGTTAPAPNTVVAEDGSSGDCNVLRVDLVVTDVNDLWGANLVVTFPANLVSFTSASEVGSVLTSGAAVDLRASLSNPGELTIGITRLNSPGVTGVDVVGGALLLRLNFVRIATQGSGTLGFGGRSELIDEREPPQSIPGTTFHGATVVIFQT